MLGEIRTHMLLPQWKGSPLNYEHPCFENTDSLRGLWGDGLLPLVNNLAEWKTFGSVYSIEANLRLRLRFGYFNIRNVVHNTRTILITRKTFVSRDKKFSRLLGTWDEPNKGFVIIWSATNRLISSVASNSFTVGTARPHSWTRTTSCAQRRNFDQLSYQGLNNSLPIFQVPSIMIPSLHDARLFPKRDHDINNDIENIL